MPALTSMEILFVFRLVGTEPGPDPYLGAKQGLTLFHFHQLKHSPLPLLLYKTESSFADDRVN